MKQAIVKIQHALTLPVRLRDIPCSTPPRLKAVENIIKPHHAFIDKAAEFFELSAHPDNARFRYLLHDFPGIRYPIEL